MHAGEAAAQSDLEEWDASRPRNAQVALGPSDTGRCLRQAAFAHHGIPPTDDRSRGQARLGSLIHAGWSAMLATRPEWMHREPDVEIQVPGLKAVGHADDVDWQRHVVNDVKTVNGRRWDRWVTFGVSEDAWDQVELYAHGLRWTVNPGPWSVRITVINRETGDEAGYERPSDPARGAWLAERLVDRQALLDASRSPQDIAREGSGPDRGFPCDYCDWMTACWPPAEGDLTPQAVTIAEDPEAIEAAGEDYLAAAEALKKFDDAKKDARAFLGGIPKGDYGHVRIGWRGGRPGPPEPDPAAAVALLEQMGVEVPMRRKQSARSISVTRVPPASLGDDRTENLGGSE